MKKKVKVSMKPKKMVTVKKKAASVKKKCK